MTTARILIVDDNTELVGVLHAVLLGAELTDGHDGRVRIEVVTASRGQEAVGIAHAYGFDVAIVDVKLPDTSGTELIVPLLEACPLGEVVLITGFATMDAAIGALRSGAFAFVPKSFRPEELLSTVEQALTKVRLKQERGELERRYRAVVEHTDVLVVGLDAGGRVELFNRRASALAGIDAVDAIGRDFLASWIPQEDQGKLRDSIAQARVRGRAAEVETGFVEVVQGVSGVSGPSVRRRVRWHVSRAEGASVYGIGIDVTERRALEKRAADAEALSAMGGLALSLAHEIRNPLNAAVLQLHLLGRQVARLPVDDDTRASLQARATIVGDEIRRLSRLLTEFLDLARPRQLVSELVHLGSLVDEVFGLERDAAAGRGIALERRIEDGSVAMGDPAKLKQVILNLVVNAFEAMKEGGTLTVGASRDGERVTLVVEDTGSGMETEVLAQAFDPFFTTKEAGTGLGLSIVRKIIDQHDGEVWIRSRPGGGTRVSVGIPAGR